MKRIAHRGYRTSNIKENTMEAFDNAVNNEFAGFEFDIRKTKDDKLVVIHDSWIDRVSEGSGLVREKTYEELLNYNFGSSNAPSRIPLVEDVLKKYKNTIKLVELKGDTDISSLEDYVDENTYFMSFDASHIKKLKEKYPFFKFGVLNYVLNSEIDYNLDFICILDIIANDDLVKKFLEKGIAVFIYGIVGEIDYQRDYENLYYIVDKKF